MFKLQECRTLQPRLLKFPWFLFCLFMTFLGAISFFQLASSSRSYRVSFRSNPAKLHCFWCRCCCCLLLLNISGKALSTLFCVELAPKKWGLSANVTCSVSCQRDFCNLALVKLVLNFGHCDHSRKSWICIPHSSAHSTFALWCGIDLVYPSTWSIRPHLSCTQVPSVSLSGNTKESLLWCSPLAVYIKGISLCFYGFLNKSEFF